MYCCKEISFSRGKYVFYFISLFSIFLLVAIIFAVKTSFRKNRLVPNPAKTDFVVPILFFCILIAVIEHLLESIISKA
jgi:hypothetical protein